LPPILGENKIQSPPELGDFAPLPPILGENKIQSPPELGDFAPLPPILGENKIQSPPELGDLGGLFRGAYFIPQLLVNLQRRLFAKPK
jgi:hypothetical protein